MRETETIQERAQVGIGTLIVFIAMVLVAAIAAGVLINTAGFLQRSAEQTGEESSSQVTNRLQVGSITGNVTDSTPATVDWVNMTVTLPPGAEDIPLDNVTATWNGPSGSSLLTVDSSEDGDSDFYVTPFKDADDSDPLMNDPDDRFILAFNSSEIGSALSANDEVTIELTTRSGGSTLVNIKLPASLANEESVSL